MNENDYERLKKEGYTEEKIQTNFDNVSRMNVFSSPMGPNRDDRGVIVTDSNGNMKRTSSIMMGYNKQGIVLENGDYVSWDEIQEALNTTLTEKTNEQEETILVCKKTGKIVEPAEVLDEIHKETIGKTYFNLEESNKITNQVTKSVKLVDESGKEYRKGIMMLGNEGLQLPSGEYVSQGEIETALKNYITMNKEKEIITPIVPPIIPPLPPRDNPIGGDKAPEDKIDPIKTNDEIKKEPENEDKFTVIKRFFRKVSIPLIATTLAAISFFGLGEKEIKELRENKTDLNTLNAVLNRGNEVVHQLTQEEQERLTNRQFIIGGQKYAENDTEFYEKSQVDSNTKKGVIGRGIRQEGEYTVEGFSILHDGKIIGTEWDKDVDLQSTLEGFSKKNNIPLDQLKPMVHMGGPVCGWFEVSDLINDKNVTLPEGKREIIFDESNIIKNTVENFSGDTITIMDGEQEVQVNIKDQDGNLLAPGSVVIGSNGEQYKIDDLNLETIEIIDTEEVVVDTKLNWSLKNITKEEALVAGGLAALATYFSLKKRKETVEMTKGQIDYLTMETKEKFKKAEGEYKGTSEFNKATETLIGKEVTLPIQTHEEALGEALIKQNITLEDIDNMSHILDEGGHHKK